MNYTHSNEIGVGFASVFANTTLPYPKHLDPTQPSPDPIQPIIDTRRGTFKTKNLYFCVCENCIADA